MTTVWILFNVFVVFAMALDLGVFHKKQTTIEWKEALVRWTIWVVLALVFCVGIYHYKGEESALNFLTGYLIEQSLSVDNLFVFLSIFTYFAVDKRHIHRVLFWGILGAIVLRAVFIFAGVLLITKFHWMIYILGALLIVAGIKMIKGVDNEVHPDKNPVLRLFRRMMPVTKEYYGDSFFVRIDNRWWATPLFIVLLLIETTDVMFAIDSVPAILAVTTDPFIVYTSNVFAILGLRSLYFALEKMMQFFHYLHYGLALILIFVGTKMLLSHIYHMHVGLALGVVAGILTLSMIASLLFPKQEV